MVNRRSVAAGRRALANELADELELFQRAAGALEWLGRCCHGRGLLPPSASRHGLPDGGSVGCQAVVGAALRRGRGRVRWLRVAKGQHGRGEGGSEIDRMLWSSRHLLGWPKTPDHSLLRYK